MFQKGSALQQQWRRALAKVFPRYLTDDVLIGNNNTDARASASGLLKVLGGGASGKEADVLISGVDGLGNGYGCSLTFDADTANGASDPYILWKTNGTSRGAINVGNVQNRFELASVGFDFIFRDLNASQDIASLSMNYEFTVGVNGAQLAYDPGSGLGWVGTVNAEDFFLNTSGTNRVALLGSNGFVGISNLTPQSTLSLSGSYQTAPVSTAVSITLDDTHHTVRATAAAVTFTLPASVGFGREYAVLASLTDPCDITPDGTDTINGNPSWTVLATECIRIKDVAAGVWRII